MHLLALVFACVASSLLSGLATAQGKSDSTGFAGVPENVSTETGIPFFSKDNADEVDSTFKRLRDAAKVCDRERYDRIYNEFQIVIHQSLSLGKESKERRQRDATNMELAREQFPPFPKNCVPPEVRQAVIDFLNIWFFFGAGTNVPLGYKTAVSGVDTFFGPGAYLVEDRSSSTGNATGFGSLRLRVETGSAFLTQLAVCDTDSPGTFGSLRFFLEGGIQSAFGAQSSLQAFQGLSGTPQAFGSNTINENFQIPIMAGVTAPVGSAGAGKPAVLLDLYGGITLDSWTQTLQGRESGAPGGPGFFAQNRRFTVDPTVGVGMRVPVGDIGGLPGVVVGVNAEFQFRPGSVVTAPSANFPSETYYGTLNPAANMAIMARIGIPLGGR
jgi:hypothetical protein